MTLSRHSAPGCAAGFIYQLERALYWLAKSPAGFVIGIETDDDVVAKGPDGERTQEQDKHSIQDGAKPFGDRSTDLWKTLSIWLQALVAGEVTPEHTRFLMVTNKTLPDCLAKRIANAENPDGIDACIAELEKIGKKPSDTIATYVKTVLLPSSRSYLKKLIDNCELSDASGNASGSKLRKKTVSLLQIPEWCSSFTDSIVDELSG